MIARKRKESEIDVKLAELEAQLRAEFGIPAPAESQQEELQSV
jgi:hypothetical protein